MRRLLSLAEKSLILPARPEEPSGLDTSGSEPAEPEDELEPAFGMLETVREYAWERLAAAGELARRARRAMPTISWSWPSVQMHTCAGAISAPGTCRLEREHDNLRAALRWLLEQEEPAEREAALRLAGALGWFWRLLGYHAESARWLQEALARVPTAQEEMEGVRPCNRSRAHPRAGRRGARCSPCGARSRKRGQPWKRRCPRPSDGGSWVVRRRPMSTAGDSVRHGTVNIVEANRLLGEALRRWEALGDAHGIVVSTLVHLAFVADMAGEGDVRRRDTQMRYGGWTLQATFISPRMSAAYLGVAVWKQGESAMRSGACPRGVRVAVTFRDRWLLSFAAQATAPSWARRRRQPRERASWGQRMRLPKSQARRSYGSACRGRGMWRICASGLHRATGEHIDAFREGRALSFDEVATTVLRLLEEATQSLPHPEHRACAADGQECRRSRRSAHANENPLTAREIEVLRLVAQGLSSKLIARQLSIAPGTVNYHLATVFNKLGVDTRAQAVAVATQRGLL